MKRTKNVFASDSTMRYSREFFGGYRVRAASGQMPPAPFSICSFLVMLCSMYCRVLLTIKASFLGLIRQVCPKGFTFLGGHTTFQFERNTAKDYFLTPRRSELQSEKGGLGLSMLVFRAFIINYAKNVSK